MTPSEIERTRAQYSEPMRVAGPATVWLVFYAAVIAGALLYVPHPSPVAGWSQQAARATVN